MKKRLDERLAEIKDEKEKNIHRTRLRQGEPKDRTAVRNSRLKNFLEKEGER